MCPLWPVHYIAIFILMFLSIHRLVISAANEYKNVLYEIKFTPSIIADLQMSQTLMINFTVPTQLIPRHHRAVIHLTSQNNDVVLCSPAFLEIPPSLKPPDDYIGTFNVTGNFMGSTNITLQVTSKELKNSKDAANSASETYWLPVTVIRRHRLIDSIFTITVAILVSILFINFGCALNWENLLTSFRSPVTLIVGIIPQFVFMPLISYILATTIFSQSFYMQLGLFFTGISPSGGASNIWVYMLGGNLNLSIAITAIGNLCAFFTMPLWTFSLGQLVFHTNSMVVPYQKIAIFAFSLLPPLLIGLLLQKNCPKLSRQMVTILKPLSSFLIVFIIVFAVVTNFYLFKLFTFKILFAGFCLPFLGSVSAWLFACCCNRSIEDRLAIAVETSVQNTGIAIFMLRFSLGQPEADLTTVVPVAVALMTPVPLLVWYGLKKIWFSAAFRREDNEDSMLKNSHREDEKSATTLIDQTFA